MVAASVSLETIKILLTYAGSINIDTQEVFNTIGFDPQLLKDSDARISLSHYQALWQEISRRSNDKDFGLHFGENTHDFCRGNVLCAVMMNCPSVNEGLLKFIKYHRLLSDLIFPQLQIEHELALLSWDTRAGILLDVHQIGSNLIMLNAVLHCLGGHDIEIKEIRFSFPSPQDRSEYKRLFPAHLIFDQNKNAIVFFKKDLSLPILLSNPQLLLAHDKLATELLQKLSEQKLWSDKVIKYLSNSLLGGESPNIDAVASELAISTRNLQLKLKEEGHTFQKISDQIRKEIAVDYLNKSDVTFYDISFLLGFAEQSSFNHAFKKWTGLNPKEYKKKKILSMI